MKIRGVLLATEEEQRAGGDLYPIDTALIKLDQDVPVSLEFNPLHRVGYTTRVWREEGRILFEAQVSEAALTEDGNALFHTAAVGYQLEAYDAQKNLIKGGTLFEVGLTDRNENRNQPKWEVVDG